MLMVIFGAGASYDSFSSFPPGTIPNQGIDPNFRPPLAQELFAHRHVFRSTMSQIHKSEILVPKLENPPPGSTVEHELERLREEALGDRERHRQLAAIRFYLRAIIWNCVRSWSESARGVSNYKTLLDSIRHSVTDDFPTCFVSFNYDTMLEDALQTQGMPFRRIEDYIADPRYKVIKLHGSVNWARAVLTRLENPVSHMSDFEVMRELIDKAAVLQFTESLEIIDQLTCKMGDRALFPTLAIPTETKTAYECPHVECLTSLLSDVAKVMIIGWRANEKTFLKLLSQKMGSPKIVIVAGSEQGGSEVRGKLISAGIRGYGKDFDNITVFNGGFSNFVRGEADRFLC